MNQGKVFVLVYPILSALCTWQTMYSARHRGFGKPITDVSYTVQFEDRVARLLVFRLFVL